MRNHPTRKRPNPTPKHPTITITLTSPAPGLTCQSLSTTIHAHSPYHIILDTLESLRSRLAQAQYLEAHTHSIPNPHKPT